MNSCTATRRLAVAGVSGLALLLTACGGGESVTGAPGAPAVEDAAGGGDCGFSEELVTSAQEEGAVTIYAGGHTREGLESVTEAFQAGYGIEVTGVREDSGAVTRMVQAELAAGNLNADVVGLASTPAMAALEKAGVLADAELPNGDDLIEGIDDPATPQVPYAVTPLGLMYNEATLEQAPETWQELAEYDGTIVLADPGASGTALQFFSMLTEELGDEWLVTLAENGNRIVTDSSLALAQLVLTGEADIGIPAIESAVVSAAAGGEPLALTLPQEALPTFSSELAVMAEAPHPNAAKLLVQYHLCRDFQEVIAGLGGRSGLEDGPPAEGVGDISDATLLSMDAAELAAGQDALIARFNELFK